MTIIKNMLLWWDTGETTYSSAEGATTPETLRQKDRTY